MARVVSLVIFGLLTVANIDAQQLFATAGQSVSGSIDRVCSSVAPTSNDYACTCQPSINGQGPFPKPVVKPAQPAGIFIQQPGEDPQFVAQQPQNAGGPIVIQLRPQDINVNQIGGGAAPEPPKIAAQGLTPPPAPAAPTTPAEEDLTALVFSGFGDSLITRCPVSQPINWQSRTWTEGGIRPYYENVGFRASIVECQQSCQARDDCFFATLAPSRQCYFLTTTHRDTCRWMAGGHFGPYLERCTPRTPCPSAHKHCGKPKCGLHSITNIFCATQNKLRAVTLCEN